MARTVLLATLARRQGLSFQLKTAGYEVIGTMTLNPSTARHEMELTEEEFLKHSKELARLCSIPGLGWYVVEFRGNVEKTPSAPAKDEPDDDLRGKPFFSLRKIATELGLDAADPKLKGVDNLKAAIRTARTLKSIEAGNAGDLVA